MEQVTFGWASKLKAFKLECHHPRYFNIYFSVYLCQTWFVKIDFQWLDAFPLITLQIFPIKVITSLVFYACFHGRLEISLSHTHTHHFFQLIIIKFTHLVLIDPIIFRSLNHSNGISWPLILSYIYENIFILFISKWLMLEITFSYMPLTISVLLLILINKILSDLLVKEITETTLTKYIFHYQNLVTCIFQIISIISCLKNQTQQNEL